MTRLELEARLATNEHIAGLKASKKVARQIVQEMIDIITDEVANDRNVDISQLGNFVARTQAPRDTNYGKSDAKQVVKFIPSDKLRKAVEAN